MRIDRSFICALLLCFSGLLQAADHRSVVVLGDSLSAAYGLDPADGWVSILSRQLAPEGPAVVNASISGETTSGGLTRLPALLKRHHPSIVILELGANDGLRGLSLEQTRQNLDAMIQLSREAGAKTLLLGIELPVNYGRSFRQQFSAIYHDLAEQYQLPLVPFLLEGVALSPELMLGDGIHPNATAQPHVLEIVMTKLGPMLDELESAQAHSAPATPGDKGE